MQVDKMVAEADFFGHLSSTSLLPPQKEEKQSN
jgi:hypothetical protein